MTSLLIKVMASLEAKVEVIYGAPVASYIKRKFKLEELSTIIPLCETISELNG